MSYDAFEWTEQSDLANLLGDRDMPTIGGRGIHRAGYGWPVAKVCRIAERVRAECVTAKFSPEVSDADLLCIYCEANIELKIALQAGDCIEV